MAQEEIAKSAQCFNLWCRVVYICRRFEQAAASWQKSMEHAVATFEMALQSPHVQCMESWRLRAVLLGWSFVTCSAFQYQELQLERSMRCKIRDHLRKRIENDDDYVVFLLSRCLLHWQLIWREEQYLLTESQALTQQASMFRAGNYEKLARWELSPPFMHAVYQMRSHMACCQLCLMAWHGESRQACLQSHVSRIRELESMHVVPKPTRHKEILQSNHQLLQHPHPPVANSMRFPHSHTDLHSARSGLGQAARLNTQMQDCDGDHGFQFPAVLDLASQASASEDCYQELLRYHRQQRAWERYQADEGHVFKVSTLL
jgi:hypothetical protein